MAIVKTTQGFWPVLANHAFRRLWTGQWLSQTAQNTVHFVLIVLIERLTGSSIHLGLMILSFTLPGVIFAPVSGVIIDRWPKKHVLVVCNLLRALLVLSYLLLLRLAPGYSNGWILLAFYALTFVMSTIGQFFNPAHAAAIPLTVERRHLLTANSLFNLTLALSQVIGLIILGPLAVKLVGINAAFILVAGLYVIAAVLMAKLPRDVPGALHTSAHGSWQRIRTELKEGASYVYGDRNVMMTMMHLTLIASLVMVLAMLAPGISARVFHLAPEDAIVVFAPAGLGMLLAAVLLGRWGGQVHKQQMVRIGLVAMAFGFAFFGLLAWRFQVTNQRLVLDASVINLPVASAALILSGITLSLFLGLSMSTVNIISQTLLQERTPEQLRGRVFSVQFMLNNLAGIPPMLMIGALADWVGIPPMLVGISLIILLVLGVTLRAQKRLEQLRASQAHSSDLTGRARPARGDGSTAAPAGSVDFSVDDSPLAPLASDS